VAAAEWLIVHCDGIDGLVFEAVERTLNAVRWILAPESASGNP
jgi:hypothetical protein